MNLSQFRFPLHLTLPLAVACGLNACVSSDSDDPADSDNGTTGTIESTTTSGSSSTTSTGSGGASSTATSTSGAGGSDDIDCSAPSVVTSPLITDFESYDGATDAASWEFNFNGDEDAVGAIYGGVFELEDGTGAYSLGFVTGADDSMWALSAQNDSAEDWGGGIGFWHGCMDASSYTGIQFMAKGSTPVGTAGMALEMPGGVSVSAKFDVPADWELVQLPFTMFSNDDGDTTNGSQIGAMSFSAHMVYMQVSPDEWVPEPGAFELTIDDLSFY